jgi:hypothetical protein
VNCRTFFTVLFVFIVTITGLTGVSLWDPDFDGYISNNRKIAKGDVVIVEISLQSNLTFTGMNKDSKNISFEFSGGEFGNVFSFLPTSKTAVNNSVNGAEKYSLKSSIVTRVKDIDEFKMARIEGTRQVTIDGKTESISLSGLINPKDLDSERKIPFDKVAESKLVFHTFIQSGEPVVTLEDFLSVTQNPADTATATTATGTPGPYQPAATTFGLSPDKKKELFIRYVNRLFDLIFQR